MERPEITLIYKGNSQYSQVRGPNVTEEMANRGYQAEIWDWSDCTVDEHAIDEAIKPFITH